MKITTWNVNGLRAVERKHELQNFLATFAPDVLFLQEIKGTVDKFSDFLNNPDEYDVFYNSAQKAGYAGTGVWIKKELKPFVKNISVSFQGDPTAHEGRLIQVTMEKDGTIFDLFGIYFPNGGKNEEAWSHKILFYREFLSHVNTLKDAGHMVLWSGDINCAHTEIDLARPKENDGKIGFHPTERAWLDKCEKNGWIDIWRAKNPGVEGVYSWWDVKTRSRETNIGWRIDAIWGEKQLFEKTKNVRYLHEQFGSDHCPMEIEIDF